MEVYRDIHKTALERNADLMIVSKNQPIESIIPYLDHGHRLFGENRVQEALSKWNPLRKRYDDVNLHLIAPLQTNKVRDAISFFNCIQSLDREKLALKVRQEMDNQGRDIPLMIQVNIGKEHQKAGISPNELEDFFKFCHKDLNLTITGLMCIPPKSEDPTQYFKIMREHQLKFDLPHLSMGMSNDYKIALNYGSNMIRLGRSLF